MNQKIAAKQVDELANATQECLPQLEKEFIAWQMQCRPVIKGEPNRIKYLPMMREIAEDPHPWIVLLLARQWGKTTHIASVLGYRASTNISYDQTYINFEIEALKTFSENKFRKDVFSSYPLSEYIQGTSKWGSMNKVALKTGSTVDMITSLRNWAHGQGKSNKLMVVDEGQDHDWTGWANLMETQADTMGDLILAGIGGFQDTQWHRHWKSTNQMEYMFDHGEEYKGYPNMSWRRELERNCFDENGIVYDQAMIDALAGDWKAQAPRNYGRHGYHLSQLQNPRIPLTRVDAIELYHVPEHFSIQAKMEDPDFTEEEFQRYVLANFTVGESKPITEKMMYALLDKNISFTPSSDVRHEDGDVFGSADWGGGPRTVVWVAQCINENYPIFKLLFAARLAGQTSDEQFETVRNIFDAYGTKQNIVDAGGGTHQVEQLQKYFGSRCLKNFYLTRPGKGLDITRAERKRLRKMNAFEVDKTYSLDAIVDLVRTHSPIGPRIIIPGKNFKEIEWIITQFVNEEMEYVDVPGKRPFRRYYTPDSKLKPDDALHACNLNRLAWLHSRIEAGHFGGPIESEREDDTDLDLL
ncbi:MAG: hypothetical protein IIC67_03755 [Thaumarchaeota archaeon]|nr:hypothetical protein [Nitrososphaerota archaeon]